MGCDIDLNSYSIQKKELLKALKKMFKDAITLMVSYFNLSLPEQK